VNVNAVEDSSLAFRGFLWLKLASGLWKKILAVNCTCDYGPRTFDLEPRTFSLENRTWNMNTRTFDVTTRIIPRV
jgi:hypothetical protein